MKTFLFTVLAACFSVLILQGCAQLSEQFGLGTGDQESDISIQATDQSKPQPVTMGWVENVIVSAEAPRKKAKLDTGATTSSINAEIVRKFKKDKKDYVVFRVYFDDENYQTFEAPVERWVRIRLRQDEESFDRRPVVKMTFCIGGELITGEVNLAERDHFLYPILVGRNMLKNRILVDSGKTFTHQPNCYADEAR